MLRMPESRSSSAASRCAGSVSSESVTTPMLSSVVIALSSAIHCQAAGSAFKIAR